MLTAIVVSFGVVFLAELPDKSQLITITYALRYRWWVVLCGAASAAAVVHGLSVTIGHFLGLTLPHRPVTFVAAVVFLLFAVWTWRGSRHEAGEGGQAVAAARQPRFVLLAIVSAYMLAELGDMTMLASVTLATKHNWVGVWVGATAAMVAANALAIATAAVLHVRLPTRLLHTLASVAFLLLGLWLLLDTALAWRLIAIIVTVGVAGVTALAAVITALRRRRAAV
ncbi:MAG: TMEM165/GDT1 family protein [Mycobacteriaceae bacterium]|nr:TMEM165/GDT1 family protein [Mycobacteriaceae bacterium]